jgi:hypothetical protein
MYSVQYLYNSRTGVTQKCILKKAKQKFKTLIFSSFDVIHICSLFFSIIMPERIFVNGKNWFFKFHHNEEHARNSSAFTKNKIEYQKWKFCCMS